ncbi:YrrS family protein [Oceanobacillus damuensis]|uniref:YrrS family protein n=1 Tax=Oceanobacillus damuensis TaxID=937928 RepID=UPI000836C564|nr:YrrS family protein [Oceanobacillus damuensis]
MGKSDNHSRLNKFEKRRKNTKAISIFLIVGAILLIILLGIWFFGGGNEEAGNEQAANEGEESSDFLNMEPSDEESNDNGIDGDSATNDDADNEESTEQTESEEEKANEDEEEENTETEPAEPSDDNVAEAYTGDWEPVGTEQEGPHTTNYSDGSQDRIEIKRAASTATGIDESEMVEWWVENGGDQKVVATVSDSEETNVYRVFMSWVDNEGWQPTKVELLIENDKKQ